MLTVILAGQVMAGSLFTITVAVTGVPVHPLADGVMVNSTVCCVVVLLTGVPVILPLPDTAIPVTFTVLFLVQLYVVPLTPLVSAMVLMGVLEHTVCDEGAATALGVGLTVIVNVLGVPVQEPDTGVTVMVAVTGAVPAFTAVKAGILPVPDAARPMDGVLLVQLYTVDGAVDPAKVIAAVDVPLQTAWFAGWLTWTVCPSIDMLSINILLPYPLVALQAIRISVPATPHTLIDTFCLTQSPAAGVE